MKSTVFFAIAISLSTVAFAGKVSKIDTVKSFGIFNRAFDKVCATVESPSYDCYQFAYQYEKKTNEPLDKLIRQSLYVEGSRSGRTESASTQKVLRKASKIENAFADLFQKIGVDILDTDSQEFKSASALKSVIQASATDTNMVVYTANACYTVPGAEGCHDYVVLVNKSSKQIQFYGAGYSE